MRSALISTCFLFSNLPLLPAQTSAAQEPAAAALSSQAPAPSPQSAGVPPQPDPAAPQAAGVAPQAAAPAADPQVVASAAPSAAEAPSKSPAALKVSYSSCNVDGQYLAMTFDDGPHPQHTPRLLDMLKQRGIKATFFLVGQNAAQYPEILKRMAAEGHELANHSYTHPILNPLGEGGIREQLDKTHQAVLSATGINMKLLRPPYGALTENMRRWTHQAFGYRTILWDVDPLDWKVRDSARVQSEILGHARAGSIVLAHDIHKSTVDAMPETLDALAAKGFKFVTVSELIAMDKPGAPKPAPATPAAKPVAKPTGSKPVAKKDASPAGKRAATVAKTSTSPANSSKSGAGTSVKAEATVSVPASAGKKPAQMTQEEIRKKWLESLKR
jgi:peptidoglycan/xylan/chitin deacetylase (PgdA/CDA1 family)